MALTAARSDLTISVVGEDETQKMLADAQANMSALEGKIKSLQRTGQAQAATASKQSSALGGLNSKMAGAAKGAEGLFEGFDKVKGVFEKASSAAMFFAPVIAGVGTAVIGAISALVGLNAGLSAHEEALFRAAGAARSAQPGS